MSRHGSEGLHRRKREFMKIDSQDEHEDDNKLIEDIRHPQIVNEEKETELENITEENETLKNKLKVIESKAEGENERLDDELGSNVNSLNVKHVTNNL